MHLKGWCAKVGNFPQKNLVNSKICKESGMSIAHESVSAKTHFYCTMGGNAFLKRILIFMPYFFTRYFFKVSMLRANENWGHT